MQVVAYLRVSTDRQADEGLGLDVQEAAVRSWARAGRHRVVAVCRDEGRSGAADLLDRPGLADALAHLHAKQARAIVVYRLDRLARDLVLQEWLRAEIVRLGCELRSTSPVEDLHLREDPDDPTGTLVRQILGAIAQYERAMIRLRMQAGRRAKLERGGYAHGRPPYGWAAAGGELVPIAAEQEVLKRIKAARRRGSSLRAIAGELDAAGITTRQGHRWSPQAISRALVYAERRAERRTRSGG